jgi:hypothetical protein
LDGDVQDTGTGNFQWKADGKDIVGMTFYTITLTDTHLKKFLTFDAQVGTDVQTTDPYLAVSVMTSLPSGGPVLPSRAQLASEFINAPTNMSWGDAYMYCAKQGERLPTVAELQTLFTTYTRANAVGEESRGDIVNTYGWDGGVRWANTGSDASHDYVYIHTNGQRNSNLNSNSYPVTCITAGAGEGLPTVTAVSIPNAAVGTPVTVAYTYNGNATIPDKSRFQWYTATNATGAGKEEATGEGATTKTYTPVTADGGKFLMVEITPASYDTVANSKVAATGTQAVSSIEISALTIEKPTAARASFQANYTVTGGTEADLTYQWYWRGEKLVGATNKTYAFPTLTIPSATTPEELKVEVAPRTQRSDIRTRAQAEAPTPVSATLALKSSIAWNAPLGQSTWYDMAKTCASQGNGNKRPGTTAELQALVTSLGNMGAYGVNASNSYWTGTKGATQGTHQIVHLGSGAMVNSSADTGAGERGLCVAGTAPAAPALGGKLANGHTFSESTFPTTGFDNAYFEFKGLKDSNANDWAYRSMDTSKAVVYNDNNWYAGVTLKAKGAVNIEVYNIAGGQPTIYTANPAWWFKHGNGLDGSQSQAAAFCNTSVSGLPKRVELTSSTQYGNPGSRTMGSLFGEWGNMTNFGWGDAYYWSSSTNAQHNKPEIVWLTNGAYAAMSAGDTTWTQFACIDK